MASLTGQTVASTYVSLLKVESSPVNDQYKTIEDGGGVDSALQISTLGVKSQGALEVTGGTILSGTLGVTGAATLATATVSGAAVCSTTLGVTGATTLSGTLGVTGATTLSTASVTGATTLSTVSVTGAASLNSSLAVAGATVLSGTLGATGATTLSSTANIVGAATCQSTLSVTGVTTATGGVTGNVTGNVTGSSGSCTGNAATATALQTTRNIALTGYVTGNVDFNGTAPVSIATVLAAPITPATVSGQDNTASDYFDLPSGNTAARPASPQAGNTRYNTTLGVLEYYNGTVWVAAGPNAWVTFDGTSVLDKSGTYTQVGTTVTASVVGHTLLAGHRFFITSPSLVDDTYIVAASPAPTADQFTFTAPTYGAGALTLVVKLRTILANRGVSSVSRVSAGNFIVNMTAAMPNANYPICLTSSSRQTSNYTGTITVNESSFMILTEDTSGVDEDASRISASVFS